MENNQFDKLFDQIADMLQFTFDNANKSVPEEKTKDVQAKLADLEKQIHELKDLNDKFIEDAGLTDYAFNTMLVDEKNEGITPEQRDILVRAENLKNVTKSANANLMKAAKDSKESDKDLKKKKEKKEPKSRKSKFRSMGGTDWKPL